MNGSYKIRTGVPRWEQTEKNNCSAFVFGTEKYRKKNQENAHTHT